MAIHIIPFQRFTIVTYKPINEVMRLLHDNIEIRQNETTFLEMFTGTLDVPFYGEIFNNHFSIKRKTSWSNNLKVALSGRIHEAGYKTLIYAKVQFDIVTSAVLGLVGLFLLFGIISSAFGDEEMSTTIGFAFSILFLWIFSLLIFAWESWRVKKKFLELIKGDISYNDE